MEDRAAERPKDIVLQNPGRFRRLDTDALADWLRSLLSELAPRTASFGVRFVNDPDMRDLNLRYRGQDKVTDVLSFPGGDSPEGHHLGDLVISVPTARRQAAAKGLSEQRELRALLLHGVLHCLGYDHETDQGAMSRLERRLRARWVGDDD
jgi:rRNA maturation RNase YbeY